MNRKNALDVQHKNRAQAQNDYRLQAMNRSFLMFLRQVRTDSLLPVMLAAPILAGLVFRHVLPLAELFLCRTLGKSSVISPWFLLMDLLLILLTPYMLCFVSAMILLSECDDHLAIYLAVTPVGKQGYLISRLLYPALLAVPFSFIITSLFSLTPWRPLMLLAVCVLSAGLGSVLSMLVVSLSRNRVEGMALAKFAGIAMFGMVVPFFIRTGLQYGFAFLPSFWIAKICIAPGGFIFILPAMGSLLIWYVLLSRKFARRLS